MLDNADWISDEEVGRRAYANYCDVDQRYKASKSNLQELIKELEKAKEQNVHVAYVMGINPKHNFEYVGNDLDLSSLNYIEATKTLQIRTVTDNELQVPDSMTFKREEGIEAFSNTISITAKVGQFSIGFLFYYE